MEISFIVVCLIIIALICIPYRLLIVLGQRENRHIASKMKHIIQDHQLQVDQCDLWNYNYIGLDTQQMKLIFYKKHTGTLVQAQQFEIIDLTRVNQCTISEQRKPVKQGTKIEHVLETLDLILTFKDHTFIILRFYDMDDQCPENWEVQRINKWHNAINTLLMSRVPWKRAS